MKRTDLPLVDTENSALSMPGIAPALQELLEQDEFIPLRTTLAIYAEILAQRAM